MVTEQSVNLVPARETPRLGRPRQAKHWPALSDAMDRKGYTGRNGWAELGAAIGKSSYAIRSYLYGEVVPDLETVILLAAALDTSEEELRKNGPLPRLIVSK